MKGTLVSEEKRQVKMCGWWWGPEEVLRCEVTDVCDAVCDVCIVSRGYRLSCLWVRLQHCKKRSKVLKRCGEYACGFGGGGRRRC